jgi:general secretion pathway protein F
MPVFMHRSTTLDGTIMEGPVSAATLQDVREKLKSSGLIPLSITSAREDHGKYAGLKASRSGLVNFTSELATLIKSGLPLDRSLQILADISEDRNMREVIDSVLKEVREGSSFSDALLARSSVFPVFYANMVRAGEAGGTLDLALSNLGEFLESTQEIKEHTTSAMIYPLILVATGGLSILLLMTFVIPRFSAVFAELGGALPLSTRILLDVSVFVQGYWWTLLPACAAVLLGFKAALHSENGKLKWDSVKLRLERDQPLSYL